MCLDFSCCYGSARDHKSVFYSPKDSTTKHEPWPPVSPLRWAEDDLGRHLPIGIVHQLPVLLPAFCWILRGNAKVPGISLCGQICLLQELEVSECIKNRSLDMACVSTVRWVFLLHSFNWLLEAGRASKPRGHRPLAIPVVFHTCIWVNPHLANCP